MIFALQETWVVQRASVKDQARALNFIVIPIPHSSGPTSHKYQQFSFILMALFFCFCKAKYDKSLEILSILQISDTTHVIQTAVSFTELSAETFTICISSAFEHYLTQARRLHVILTATAMM
jgi:hypothetical protein